MPAEVLEAEATVHEIALAPQHNNQQVATQPRTPQELRAEEIHQILAPAYRRACELQLSDSEVAALMVPFPIEYVEKRPDGGFYFIGHIHISNRLNEVLKPGQWTMIRRREWVEGGDVYGDWVLIIRGCFVGECVSGHPYVASNKKTDYADALESTRGVSLRRIASKCLSCGSQVWSKKERREMEKRGVDAGDLTKRQQNYSNEGADIQPKESIREHVDQAAEWERIVRSLVDEFLSGVHKLQMQSFLGWCKEQWNFTCKTRGVTPDRAKQPPEEFAGTVKAWEYACRQGVAKNQTLQWIWQTVNPETKRKKNWEKQAQAAQLDQAEADAIAAHNNPVKATPDVHGDEFQALINDNAEFRNAYRMAYNRIAETDAELTPEQVHGFAYSEVAEVLL